MNTIQQKEIDFQKRVKTGIVDFIKSYKSKTDAQKKAFLTAFDKHIGNLPDVPMIEYIKDVLIQIRQVLTGLTKEITIFREVNG